MRLNSWHALATACACVLLPAAASPALQGQSAADSVSLADLPIERPTVAALHADGSLLVSGQAQLLGLIRANTGQAVRLATPGAGPGEYRSISALFACEDQVGWVDGSLRRIVWLDAATLRSTRQLVLPNDVASAGTPVRAACARGALWVAFEKRTGGRDRSSVRDTVRVYRLDVASEHFSETVTMPSSSRLLQTRGSLNASLRLPWFGPPSLVPLASGQLGIVPAEHDSLIVLDESGVRLRSAALPRAGRVLSNRERALVRDSMRNVIEAEMEGLKYDEALRTEFRRLHESLRGELSFPARWPFARLAVADPGGPKGLLILEHADLRDGTSCVTVLTPGGAMSSRRCYAWPGRTIFNVVPSRDALYWVQGNDDGETWILRTARP